MLYNRKLSTLEFFNIACTLPIIFLDKYKALTYEQCNEIVFMKDSKDKNIFDYYAVNDEAKLQVMESIVFNLSIENFKKVILTPCAHKRTLLHNLLMRKTNTEAFLTKLAEKLSADIFKKFTLLQDSQGQYEYSALICAREIEKTQDKTIINAKLKLQVLRLQYKAAEIFDEQNVVIESDGRKNPIHQLNLTVYSYLAVPHEDNHMMIIDEDSYNQVIFEIVNTLQAAIEKEHANHLAHFKTYIEKRAQVKIGMFSNTENDLQARKAYYVLLTTPNYTIDDVQAKLRTILKAQSDKQITKGISKQCLGFINQIKSDCENYIYLHAVKMEFEEELLAIAAQEIEDRHVLQR
jgi:hypothetical protein